MLDYCACCWLKILKIEPSLILPLQLDLRLVLLELVQAQANQTYPKAQLIL